MAIPDYLVDFIKVEIQGGQVEIWFDDFDWHGQEPVSHKVLLYTLRLARWEKGKEKYLSRILNNKKYFRICGLCGEVNHRGHMHDAYVCQHCETVHYGVIY